MASLRPYHPNGDYLARQLNYLEMHVNEWKRQLTDAHYQANWVRNAAAGGQYHPNQINDWWTGAQRQIASLERERIDFQSQVDALKEDAYSENQDNRIMALSTMLDH